MRRPPRIALADVLAELNGWSAAPGEREAITRTFRFDGFPQAFAFMTECALTAERLDHHPEWSNVYGRVEVVLRTHDCEGVTALDLALARAMDAAAARFRS